MLIWNVVNYVRKISYGSSSITFNSFRRRSSSTKNENINCYCLYRINAKFILLTNLLLSSIVLDCS